MATAKSVDASALSAEDAQELNAAIAEAEAILGSTAGVAGAVEKSEERIRACLIKIGVMEAPAEEEEPSDFFANASEWLYNNYGTNGFSEMPILTVINIFKAIGSLISLI